MFIFFYDSFSMVLYCLSLNQAIVFLEVKNLAYIKWNKTKYPGIFEYETKRGKRYGVRINYSLHSGGYHQASRSGFKTLTAAKAYKQRTENEIEQNQGLSDRKITLDEWFNEYMEFFKQKNHSNDTIRHKENIYKNHIKPVFGKRKLESIRLDEYEKFLYAKINNPIENLSINTVKTIHRSMKAIINAAVKYEKLYRNKLIHIDIEALTNRTTPVATKALEKDELKKCLVTGKKILSKYDYSMVYLASWGLRRGEIAGLRRKNLEFDDKNKMVSICIDSSRTQYTPEWKGTKTQAGTRKILLKGEGYSLLKYALKRSDEIAKDFEQLPHQNDFLFRSPTSNKPYAITRLNQLTKRISKALGIHLHPHMLRHSFVTQAALAGANQADVQQFVGHKNLSMTEYYTHLTNQGTSQLVDMISEELSDK